MKFLKKKKKKYSLLVSSLTLYDLLELRPVTPLTKLRKSGLAGCSLLVRPGTSSARS